MQARETRALKLRLTLRPIKPVHIVHRQHIAVWCSVDATNKQIELVNIAAMEIYSK